MKKQFKSMLNDDETVKDNFDISNAMNEAQKSIGFVDNVMSLNPDEIANWEFRDRKEFELGDIDGLAESIKLKGQAQPIIVVKTDNTFKPKEINASTGIKYIVIAGYRRWLACKKHGLKIDAIIKRLNFTEAVTILEGENEKESVSDYSKGMFYSAVIQSEKITKDELRKKLGLQPAYFSNLLAFSAIPDTVWEAIGDASKVSSRTAALLRSYINKDIKYENIIISIADKIRSGIGEKRITGLIESIGETKRNSKATPKAIYIDGNKAFSIDSAGVKINKAFFKDNNDMSKCLLEIENIIKSKMEEYK
ncbi:MULTISPECIES: ParB/RepB/Spo0J family partition protein [Cysteiniphilum]|nr:MULTISPECIES: ParB/RepB/Spo0J family partition protein [Cysteiniphilum]